MKNFKFAAFGLLILIGGQQIWGSNDYGLPGEFLNFGVGARAMAMGRAFTAVADDVDAIYWNPAGLATFRASEITFQHDPLELDGSHQFLAYSQPLYAYGSFGIGVVNLNSGSVPRYNKIDDTHYSENGDFEARETAYMGSYAQRFGDHLAFGGTVKMAENSIDGHTKRGYGADAGTIIMVGERARFGVMLRNLLAPTYDFASDKETFPTILRTGAAVKFFKGHMTTSLDLEKTIGVSQSPKWFLGVEGYVIRNIFLRAGVDQTEITAGLGIRWKAFQLDYAAGFQDLGYQNRFSFKFFFGGFDVDVKASPSVFSPVGLKNTVTFKVQAVNQNRIVKWILSIRNANGEVVRSFQGFKAPPSIIEWDGKNARGELVKAGQYTYEMVVTDNSNRLEKTPVRNLKVLAPSPFEIEAK